MKNIFLLTPYFLDQRSPGLDSIDGPDWEVNRLELPVAETQQRMVALYRPLRDAVSAAAKRGLRPVSVAGDCCTSIGFLAGLQQAGVNPTLLWFDAHGDFNDWQTTPSGFLGGMPLAMLVGRGEQTMPEGVGLESITENKVILSDARDLDPGERESLIGSNITHYPDPMELLDVPLPKGPLYVHFDADFLDPADAPAMSYLTPGGPPVTLIREIFKRLNETGRVAGVSLSAWNPQMDEAARSRSLVMALLSELVQS